MFTTDFVFDGKRASDMGLVICSFDDERQPATGGEVEFEVVKPPENDKFEFYGAQYTSPLEWNISIMKNPCKYEENLYFTNEDERMIYKWLQQRDGYHWFCFCEKDEDAEVFFQVKINLQPHVVSGHTIGFDMIITANSAFGYSALKKKKATINKNTSFTLYIDTDTNAYILPEFNITGSGTFYISNNNDPKRNHVNKTAADFKSVSGTIYMNSEFGVIDGVEPENFNWRFLRLVDGKNVFSTDSANNITLEIFYREVRRIAV